MAAVGRVPVLVLLLVFSTGHAGVCAVAGWFARDAAQPAPTCPLHRSQPASSAVTADPGTAAMSCCQPAERRDDARTVTTASTVIPGEPANQRIGTVLPPASPYRMARARDSAPPKSVRTHLLLSVFLV